MGPAASSRESSNCPLLLHGPLCLSSPSLPTSPAAPGTISFGVSFVSFPSKASSPSITSLGLGQSRRAPLGLGHTGHFLLVQGLMTSGTLVLTKPGEIWALQPKFTLSSDSFYCRKCSWSLWLLLLSAFLFPKQVLLTLLWAFKQTRSTLMKT